MNRKLVVEFDIDNGNACMEDHPNYDIEGCLNAVSKILYEEGYKPFQKGGFKLTDCNGNTIGKAFIAH